MKSLKCSSIIFLFFAIIYLTMALEEQKEVKTTKTEEDDPLGKTEKLVTADSFNVGYYGHGHAHAPHSYANHYSHAKYVVPSPAYSVAYSYGYPVGHHGYSAGHHQHHGYTSGHHLNYVTPAYIPIYTTAGHYPHHTGLSTSYNYGYSTHGRLAAHGLVSPSHGVPLYNSHRYHRFGVYH